MQESQKEENQPNGEKWTGLTRGLKSSQETLVQMPSVLKRLLFLVMGILALTGVLDSLLLAVGWGNIYDTTEEILNASMKSAAANTMMLAVLKGLIGILASVEGGVVVVTANVGAFFTGFSELVDLAFNFFLTMSGLLAAKIGFIKIIELTGVSVFAGPAFILMAFDPSLRGTLGKLGKTLMAIGLVMFFLFPLAIASVGSAYANHRINTEIQYTENLGILSERASEINFRSLTNEEGRSNALGVIRDGTGVLWDGFMNLVVSYILMFVLLPLASLGLCYLIIKQILTDTGNIKEGEHLSAGVNSLTGFMFSKNKQDKEYSKEDGE
ncbi:MAG: hypothetical protein IBX55_21935 [Methyloprofundus sp.]|nr:hypothetical protein [Methyloprofundus sp.]